MHLLMSRRVQAACGLMNFQSCHPKDQRMRKESAASSLNVSWWKRGPTVDNTAGRSHVLSPLQVMWPFKMSLRNPVNYWLTHFNSLKVVRFQNSTASKTEKKETIKPDLSVRQIYKVFYKQLSFIKPICMQTNERILNMFLAPFPFSDSV